MFKIKDITGKRFGRLVVIERGADYKPGSARWVCLCDCGNKTLSQTGSLNNGSAASCGCLRRERSSMRETTHGMSYTRLYATYSNMKDRCINRNSHNWDRYGGRGIFVCDDWLGDVESFLAWARNAGYAKGLSLDRIDNDGPYSPENCRWTDTKTQCRNKSNNKYVTFNGEQVLAIELSEQYAVSGRSVRRWHDRGILEKKIAESIDRLLQGVPQSETHRKGEGK